MDLTRFTVDETGTARLQTSKGVLMLDAGDLGILGCGSLKIKKGYASLYRGEKPRRLLGAVARLIMNAPTGAEVDHINHDTLDNRRCNLRLCTRSENRRNGRKQRQSKSRFKGVFYHHAKKYKPNSSEAKPWRAYTRVMGNRIWLGYYATDTEAAMAYNRFAATAFGEFACFNRFDRCPALEVLPPLSAPPSKLCEALKEY